MSCKRAGTSGWITSANYEAGRERRSGAGPTLDADFISLRGKSTESGKGSMEMKMKLTLPHGEPRCHNLYTLTQRIVIATLPRSLSPRCW
jgi:hypothetical protein